MVEEIFRRRSACSTSGRSCRRGANPRAAILRLDFDFFALLDAVTIARSRKHIQAFYDTSDIGPFPDGFRRSPFAPADRSPDVPSFNELFAQLSSLTLAVYAPLAYVFD